MWPQLVEPNIVNIMKYQLNECNKQKLIRNTIKFNVIAAAIIIFIICVILYIKYKGKQDTRTMNERENKKRDYILSKLQFYQKIKTKEFTNMTN
jgi:Na+/H+ antiporter NhaD/arsenite permease-like protein